ncbi:SufS family cysteine desulfurase [Halobaculum rubrum]|uniref:SufS family cysteine desulfurase n=1 Tax=Halobaculum rubrum TaxID=2872158 RepID=UPI001CA44C7F|nr:SufS family cysteine desulfurase [Halobaculum rubrum]QZX99208.1 SufS family cysteine desulfurase [Halobaculum rubrum]
MTFDAAAVREDFPVLDRRVNGHPLTYLDNAATTHTPRQVYDVFEEFYAGYNANIHRGIHELSHEASIAYEQAHDRVADFLGADGREEIVFTKNTTESINLVAYGLSQRLDDGDEIVTTEMDHHASLVTWQQIAKRAGATVRHIPVTPDGHLDMDAARDLVTDDTAVVCAPHVSNVLGTINPIEDLVDLAHDHDAYAVVDGAQSAPTRPVDVGAMDADFFAFSGHKLAGPTGIGGLYGKRAILEDFDPFLFGGEMIRNVTLTDSTWNELPWKFEAGTPPIAEGIALGAAVEYLEDLGMENVRAHENELAQYLLRELAERDFVRTYGPGVGEERTGLVSFNVDGVHGHDLSSLLNDRGIAIRAGDHCTQPLHDRLDIPGSARASVYVYNTRADIDRLLEVVDTARDDLGDYLASERYHDLVSEHYHNPRNRGDIGDPTFVKSSEETTCGDDGEFHVTITDDRIEEIAFESRSCAVSRAVASLLSEHLEGMAVAEVAEIDGYVARELDGQYPDLRRECVEGPEDVIREAAREYVETKRA